MSLKFIPFISISFIFHFLSCLENKTVQLSSVDSSNLNRGVDFTFSLFTDGRYEDYLQFFNAQDEKPSWEDFLKLQNRVRNFIFFEGNSLREKLIFWIPKITQFLIDNDFELRQIDSLDSFECIWKEYLNENFKTINFPLELKSVLQASFQLIKLDVFIYLASGPKAITEFISALKEFSYQKLDLAFFIYTLKIIHSQQLAAFKLYDSKTYAILEKTREMILKESEASQQELYQHYWNYRSENLGFDSKSPLHPIFTRIGSILQLNNELEGKILKESLLQLQPDDLALVIEEFSLSKVSLDFIFPMALVEFLNRIQRSSTMGKTAHDRLFNVVRLGVPLVAKILKQQRLMILKREIDASIPLILKSEEAKLPQDLNQWKDIGFELKKDGIVLIY